MFTGKEAKGETKKRAGDREPRREQPLSRRSGKNGITGWQEQQEQHEQKEREREKRKGRKREREGWEAFAEGCRVVRFRSGWRAWTDGQWTASGALFCPGPEREKEAASTPKPPKRGCKDAPSSPLTSPEGSRGPQRAKDHQRPLQRRGATKPQWVFYWLVALSAPPVP
ncbi:hypothetical protein G7Z17_g9967 [Cylindrodendrum hubeiense]|uniref:Uncharacterized protein n=1 Tax=Cylindrodendrum hubeiense TaxID=595255 RepID=A0A9P5GYI1_9HYPO|nr:hypothetical protein G7Z17_g9967 [Cylindrodendrum hubeiense]